MNIEQLEERIIRSTSHELIIILQELELIPREKLCITCRSPLKMEKSSQFIDKYAWRCVNTLCHLYRMRFSIRQNTFFYGFKINMKRILRILLKYASANQNKSILSSLHICKKTLTKIINKLIFCMIVDNRNARKLGGPGTIVQVDETMLNYKCKSHRGRSAENKSDALVIAETRGHVTQIYAEIIRDKTINTIMPIICSKVLSFSEIHTDEHRSYFVLPRYGYIHETVCHKYSFVNRLNAANTQAVESVNNCIKQEIKKRKGVLTRCRSLFLSEFIWKWNHNDNFLESIFNLIKKN